MFGKSVPLLAIVMVSLLAIGASAVLVDYLSNTVTKEVATVTSPMAVGISYGRASWADFKCFRPGIDPATDLPYGMVYAFPEGLDKYGVQVEGEWDATDWTEPTATITVHGGETVTIYTMSANLADAEIKGHEEIILSNEDGISQVDFVTITSRFDSIYGDQGYGKLHTDVPSGDVQRIDPDSIELWKASDTSTWGAGETDVARWDITFNSAASGTYTFSYRIVPVTP